MNTSLHAVCPSCLAVNRIDAGKLSSGPVCGKCKAGLIPGKPVNLTGAGFARFIERSDLPVLVDFWAPWCGPCKMMAPAFEQAAAMLAPGVIAAKVDTQAEQALGARYGVSSIPTLMLFSGGREVRRQAGAVDAQRIVAFARAGA
ncbi:MAG: thioredoxin TrxC [Desulfovibrionaceae bacterium]|nr:thioredoxin TrxC [Desulfovibrionaceae bacterium]MBF0512809.1 thioredoxin TrxC [Desulfovibrionaceae bacterium]